MEAINENPLGVSNINTLIRKFALPSIMAMLVGALYNIVDQFFIGRSVGELGNAATNVSFPLSISCIAIALFFGLGGASAFNISLGEGDKEKAVYYIGNASVLLFGCGLVLCIIAELFLTPLLVFFGSPENVLSYAKTYTGITAIGFPFLIFSTGGGHLIRADGSPKYTMLCNLSGAVINTILDPIFIFGFDMGMTGAALATIIGQVFSAWLVFHYLLDCRSVHIERRHLIPKWQFAQRIMSLGAASCFNQVAMMIVQIVLNKSLVHYGALSSYGKAVPLASAGIITKVNQLFFAVIIGIAQGMQPIAGFNYGAKKYDRVKKVYFLSFIYGLAVALPAFLLFQIFPRDIISIFGSGTQEYYNFAVLYFRVFLFFTFLNFMQPMTSTFFTAIGKPKKGIFLSLTRQILFLLPLIIILPIFMGIDGIMYAGPIADFVAAAVSVVMILTELRHMGKVNKMSPA